MGGGRVIHEGYLTKSPPTDDSGQPAMLKGWKKRYFRLFESKILEYSETDTSKNPKGTVNLEDCLMMQEKYAGNPLRFSLSTPKRTYFMNAKSQEEYEQWVRVLTEAGGFSLDEAASTEDQATEDVEEKPKSLFRRFGSRRGTKRQGSISTLRRNPSMTSSNTVEAGEAKSVTPDDLDFSDIRLRGDSYTSSSSGGGRVSPEATTGPSSRSAHGSLAKDRNSGSVGESNEEERPYSMTPVADSRRRVVSHSERTSTPLAISRVECTGSPSLGRQVSRDSCSSRRLSSSFQEANAELASSYGSNYVMVASNRPLSSSLRDSPNYSMVPCNKPLSSSAGAQRPISTGQDLPDNSDANYTVMPSNRPMSRTPGGDAQENYVMVPSNKPLPAQNTPSSNPGMRRQSSATSDGASSASPYAPRSNTADSGVASFMSQSQLSCSSSAGNHDGLYPTPSPPKRSPPLQRVSQNNDEGIVDDMGDLQLSRDVTLPNRASSATCPIDIPGPDARAHKPPLEGSPASRRSVTTPMPTASSGSVPVGDLSATGSLVMAPPRPNKPNSFSPKPGQAFQNISYATLTADDLRVDRSAKPTRGSPVDPSAPQIDRSSKPKAPIHATIPETSQQQFTAVNPAYGQHLMIRSGGASSIALYDGSGNPVVLPPGMQLTLQATPESGPAPAGNYSHPPAPLPNRVGSMDHPYSVPMPARTGHDQPAGFGNGGHSSMSRRLSTESTSSSRSSMMMYEQIPSNRPVGGQDHYHSGSHSVGMSRASHGSVGSRGSVGSASMASRSSFQHQRSISECNDGGDYVFTPTQHPRQSSNPLPPEEGIMDEEYEVMNPGAVYGSN